MNARPIALLAGLVLTASAAPAGAFDPEATFREGTVVLSAEGAYGWQIDIERGRDFSAQQFWDAGVRVAVLPLDTMAKSGVLYGALEVGLEPFYQRYVEPRRRFWAGLAGVARYHFLGLGRLVPYVELAAAAGGTDLRVPEIRSTFAFLLWGGVGASVFVAENTAVYAGYRWQHVSNGNTSKPNRGFESSVAVAGLSLFF